MRKITFLAMLFLVFTAFADETYTTPGTGVKWSFDDLVANSDGVVVVDDTNSGKAYIINEDMIIAATDEIFVDEDILVRIASGVNIEFQSAIFTVDAPNLAEFTAKDQITPDHFGVFYFRDASKVNMKNAKFTYGKGIRIAQEDDAEFEVDNCEFSHNHYTTNTAGAISMTRGKATIKNSTFFKNNRAAISSGANMGATFHVENNHIEANTQGNTNRPQINLGPCRDGETTMIIGNTIIGDRTITRAGGISTSSLLSVPASYRIEGNTIKDNRYGITLTGANIVGEVIDNVLENNNTEGNPALGGSGINLTSSSGKMNVMITGNTISGHLWGITSVGDTKNYTEGPKVNLGNLTVPESDSAYNPGLNVFANNGNGGTLCDFYNNSPVDVMAQGNTWGVAEQDSVSIETVIVHKPFDERYGLVTFMYYDETDVEELKDGNSDFVIYPNPVRNSFTVDIENRGLSIYDISGKQVYIISGQADRVDVSTLNDGIYIIELTDSNGTQRRSKFMKVR